MSHRMFPTKLPQGCCRQVSLGKSRPSQGRARPASTGLTAFLRWVFTLGLGLGLGLGCTALRVGEYSVDDSDAGPGSGGEDGGTGAGHERGKCGRGRSGGGDQGGGATGPGVEQAGAKGVQEIVIGMAHRGRLNVLVNTLGKMPGDLFAEFDHTAPEDLTAGDVKYHQGFSSDVSTPGGPVHLSLAFNPSHLEIVNPVVEGSVRARMDRRGDAVGAQVLPVLVHGDAAFGGQGVNQETLCLAQTRGYTTGGTVHIIINNQIGFTTSDPRDMRSSAFCTDIVKMVESPVLHVNGDDPEAVVLATQLALEYRMEFRQDVVVDITCFRKLGHNEQDTPALTQPLMYKKIATHPGTRKLYADKLAAQGMGETLGDDMVQAYRAAMDAGRHTVDPVLTNFKSKYAVDWAPFLGKKWTDAGDTAIPLTEWKRLVEKLTTLPASISPHSLVKKVYDDRAAMGRGEINVDWGMGEHMAFASLVASGYPVRLSGEDCGRGTFTHRHAVLHDQKREKFDEGIYVPLENVAEGQAPFVVIDSILSEEAVLAFEYGYASNDPNTLVIWEAQFGDFANGAQVVIDQFIASGEVKWGRVNGITLMLPHGYEGQGPEHSSARLERFLQLCGEDNMQVVNITTPANMFHALRRQVRRNFRKPLIVMTPKSLLRHKLAISDLKDFAPGTSFTRVYPEVDALAKDADVRSWCGMEHADAVERHPRLGQRHDLADDRPDLLVGVGDRDDARRGRRLDNRTRVGDREPGANAGAPHGGVGTEVARDADHHRGIGGVENGAEELGDRRRGGRREVPDQVPEGCKRGLEVVTGRGGVRHVGLIVELGQPGRDRSLEAGGDPRRASAFGLETLQRRLRDVAELGVQRGERRLGRNVIAHPGEGARVVAQGEADRGAEHRIGEGMAVEQLVGGEELGEAERREERHVGDADRCRCVRIGGPQLARHQEAPGCKPCEVGRHDGRDRRQCCGALGGADRRRQRLAGGPPRGHDVNVSDHRWST